MKKSFLTCLILVALMAPQLGFSQLGSGVLDGAYVKETNPTRRVIEYPYLREADVLWVKRVWVDVDLRQKINHPLYYPLQPINERRCLFDVIKRELMERGSMVAYPGVTPDGDFVWDFKYAQLTKEQTELAMGKKEKKVIYDEDPNSDNYGLPIGDSTIVKALSPEDIVRYRIKEDWIFDKQRSQRYIRIIGLAPMIFDETAANLGFEDEGSGSAGKLLKPMFWLYYPEWRYVLANYTVFNPNNPAQEMSFDDLFQKRWFNGMIVKDDNVYDRSLEQTWGKGLDVLLAGEEIKEQLFVREHDVWHY